MKNPNAIAGVAGAGLGGQIVLEVSSWFGWSISSGLAIWIAALVTGFVLYVGRNGLKGLWRKVWNGQQGAGEVGAVALGVILLGVILLVLKAY